jgi:hypothetical protein
MAWIGESTPAIDPAPGDQLARVLRTESRSVRERPSIRGLSLETHTSWGTFVWLHGQDFGYGRRPSDEMVRIELERASDDEVGKK